MIDCGKTIMNKGDSAALPCTWYLIHQFSHGKFHVIMNGAAQFLGMSINDCLVKGPEHTGS